MAWVGRTAMIDCHFAIASGFRMRTALLLALLSLTVTACGYKGPLYLPKAPPAASAAQ